MRAEFINPFVKGATDVLTMMLAVTPSLGTVSARPKMFTTKTINVVCGITGDLQGQVIYGMNADVAERFARAMLGGMEVDDELAISSLAELGNMISGNSLTILASQGFTCDITPPSIIRGTDVVISTVHIPALVIPVELANHGALEINVSLKEREAAQAA